MDYEAAVHDMLSIGAGMTSRESRVDARGAHNDLACAFVFLVVCAKPAATLVPRHLQAHRPPSARSQSRQLRQHRAEAEEQVE